MIEAILRDLRQPEYVHVLLNPLPVYGLAVALLGLILAICLGSGRGQITALSLIFLCAASAWPVVHFGQAAESSVLAIADEEGQAWLKAHARRAGDLIPIFAALALVSAAAILFPRRWPATARPLTLATALLALVSLGVGGYIGHAGGRIRHKEFRNTSPPATTEDETR